MDATQKEGAKPVSKVVMANASVEAILKNFKENVYSLIDYFQDFAGIAKFSDSSKREQSKRLVEEVLSNAGLSTPIPSKKDIEGREAFTKQLEQLLRTSPKAADMITEIMGITAKPRSFEIFSRSSFLMLNNYFEYLLADLLAYFYNKFQGSLNDKKFDFTLKELNEYETINEAVKAFVTKEVEAMMVELTFEKLLDHFATKLKINNEKELINWSLITECRERRHLIVHNASIVNKKYLIRTGSPSKLKLGDVVHVDREYFAKACIEFYLAGLLLCYNCWGSWDKETADDCVENILDESFSLLTKKEYEATYKLADYATKNIESRNDDQEDELVRINFNKLIALKKLDKKAIFDKEVKKVKTGTSAPIYKLVHSILLDKHEDLVSLVRLARGMEDLEPADYEKWPIFDFVRDIPELHEAISKELGLQVGDENAAEEGSALGLES